VLFYFSIPSFKSSLVLTLALIENPGSAQDSKEKREDRNEGNDSKILGARIEDQKSSPEKESKSGKNEESPEKEEKEKGSNSQEVPAEAPAADESNTNTNPAQNNPDKIENINQDVEVRDEIPDQDEANKHSGNNDSESKDDEKNSLLSDQEEDMQVNKEDQSKSEEKSNKEGSQKEEIKSNQEVSP